MAVLRNFFRRKFCPLADAPADDETNTSDGLTVEAPTSDDEGGGGGPLKRTSSLLTAADTELFLAAQAGLDSVVEELLKAGTPVNATTSIDRDMNGATALMSAAEKGHKSTVLVLLTAGASVDSVDKRRKTALMWAAEKGHHGVVEELLKAAASVNAVSKYGETALTLAADKGHDRIVELLLKSGASVNGALDNGFRVTPLLAAAKSGWNNVLELLITAGASVDVADKQGATALMYAVRTGRTELLELVLRANPKVDASDKSGETALMWAAKDRHKDCVRMLLEAGASADVKRSNGDTPLLIAATAGSVACMAVLLSKCGDRLILDVTERLLNVTLSSKVAELLISTIACIPLRAFDKPCHDASGPYIRAFLMLTAKFLPPSKFNSSLRDLVLSQATAVEQIFAMVLALKELTHLSKTSPTGKDLFDNTISAVVDALTVEMTNQQRNLSDHVIAALFESSINGMSLLETLLDCGTGELFLHPLLSRYLDNVWLGGSSQRIDWSLLSFARFFPRDLLEGNMYNLSLKCRRWRWADPWVRQERPFKEFERRAPRALWNSKLTFLGAPKGRWLLESAIRLVFVALIFLFVSATPGSDSDSDSGSAPARSGAAWVGVEVSFWVFVAGYFVAEADELRRQGWRKYASLVWNVVDMAMLLAFLLAAAARLATAAGSVWNPWPWRTVLAVSSLLSWVRLLELFMVHKQLGPLVVSVMHMAGDVAVFMSFFLVVLAGFVQAFLGVGLLSDSPLLLTWALLQGFLGRDTDQLSFLGLEQELPVIGPLLFFLFLCVTTILLLNLLTAQFAFTFQRVADNSRQEFALKRARLLVDRQPGRGTAPPPFNLIEVCLFPLGREVGQDVATVAVYVAMYPFWLLSVWLVFLVSTLNRLAESLAATPVGRVVRRVCFKYVFIRKEWREMSLVCQDDVDGLVPNLRLDGLKEEEENQEGSHEASDEASDDGLQPFVDERDGGGVKPSTRASTTAPYPVHAESESEPGSAARWTTQDEERGATGAAVGTNEEAMEMPLTDTRKLLNKVVQMEQILSSLVSQRDKATQGPGQGQEQYPSQRGRQASNEPLEPATLTDVRQSVASVSRGKKKKQKFFSLSKSA